MDTGKISLALSLIMKDIERTPRSEIDIYAMYAKYCGKLSSQEKSMLTATLFVALPSLNFKK